MWTAVVIAVAAVFFPTSAWTEEGSSRQVREMVRATADEARPFLGQWTSIVEGPSGPTNVRIEVRVSEGLVHATVDSDLMGENEVQDITNAGRGIALRYATELWGYSSVVVIVLVPRGEQLAADFSLMNGQFQFSGLLRRSEEPIVPSERSF
jgi:hypothetical protein